MVFNPHMLVLARDARGITQADLAARLSAGQGTVSKYETGLSEAPTAFVDDVAELLRFPRTRQAIWPASVSLQKAEKAFSQITCANYCGNEPAPHSLKQNAGFFSNQNERLYS
jgi:transcriptional regulator with XRE-family HTH domain